MNNTPELPTRNRGQHLTPDLQPVQSGSLNELPAPDETTRVDFGMPNFPGDPLVESKSFDKEIEQHGKDVKLGRQIFALAQEGDDESHPVRYIPLSEVNDEFKQASRDLAQAAHEKKHLLAEAETHPVTGLPNKKACDRYLNELIDDQGNQNLAFAMLDLDGFKDLNDRFGHALGDKVLKRFGEELQKRVRKEDLVTALGGDEFGIIMPDYVRENSDMNSEEREAGMINHFRSAALQVLEEIKADPEVRRLVLLSGKDVFFDTSVGISLRQKNDTVDTLKKRADDAMYVDKESRKAVHAKQSKLSYLLSKIRGVTLGK